MPDGVVLIVGGTGGLGRELAARYRERGAEVIITGRDAERASAVAAEIGDAYVQRRKEAQRHRQRSVPRGADPE